VVALSLGRRLRAVAPDVGIVHPPRRAAGRAVSGYKVTVVTWILITVVGWLAGAAAVGVFAVALGRAAAIGDRTQQAQVEWDLAELVRMSTAERRVATDDRRAERRPWAAQAPGRRAEDVLRQEIAEAHRALGDAQARLQEIERRESA
jgi:hypothetical protein